MPSGRKRVRLIVEVDLDPVPGWGNCAEDWQQVLTYQLQSIAGHYHPAVTIEGGTK
jgi:hypothetical protein